jgi:hypothetical protein
MFKSDSIGKLLVIGTALFSTVTTVNAMALSPNGMLYLIYGLVLPELFIIDTNNISTIGIFFMFIKNISKSCPTI